MRNVGIRITAPAGIAQPPISCSCRETRRTLRRNTNRLSTGAFSAEASGYVDHIDPKVVLIDGKRLAELMIDFDLGVATARTYHVKKIDSDYFDEE
jgi:hypothetical protein